MEWLVIILSGFLTAITPTGLIIDQVIADNLRQQVQDVDVLAVRVDNVPSYQIIQGKVQKVRIASRGIELIENVRIDTLELETDSIGINIQELENIQNLSNIRQALEKPLQGAIRLVITETDINEALNSENIQKRIQVVIDNIMPESSAKFTLSEAKIDFLDNQRIKVNISLQQDERESINLELETGLNIIEGRSLELIDPQASINGRQLSARFLNPLIARFSDNVNLKSLEKQGIIVRILQADLTENQMNLALFARLEPL